MKLRYMAIIILLIPMVFAHGEATFAEAEEIIDAKTPCDELTNDELEIIGDYYMEQMHPGEQHEFMDERMGGEGSESLRQMHINMARSFYCGEHEMMNSGMMNTMMGGGMMGSGMMGSQYYLQSWYENPLWLGLFIVVVATLAGLAFWGTKRFIRK